MKKKHSIIIDNYNKGVSATSLAKKFKTSTTAITRILKKNEVKMRSGKGKEHSGWKGGRSLKSGYWTVYAPEHPRVLNNNRVFEHILIAEKKYGRYISKLEPIHHIDFDRTNNNPENLYLCKDNTEHKNLHVSLELIARELCKKGIIKFSNGRYFV